MAHPHERFDNSIKDAMRRPEAWMTLVGLVLAILSLVVSSRTLALVVAVVVALLAVSIAFVSDLTWLRALTTLAALIFVALVAAGDGQSDELATPPTTTTTTPPATTTQSTTTTTTQPTTTTQSTTTTTTPTTTAQSTTTTTAPPTTTTVATQFLVDTEVVGSDNLATSGLDFEPAVLDGVTYTQSVLIDPSGEQTAYVDFLLRGRFRCLSAQIGVIETMGAGTAFAYSFLDPDPGATRPVLQGDSVSIGQPRPIEVDVSDVFNLRIQVTEAGVIERTTSTGRSMILGDARLTSESCT